MAEDNETKKMITELYNKLVLKTDKPDPKPRRVSLRQYFIMCYTKEGIYGDMTPFELTRETIEDVANLAAQITFKLLTTEQKQIVEEEYRQMTDEQLEHLRLG